MHVVRHNDSHVKCIANSVIMNARVDRDVTSFRRQNPTRFRTGGYEMGREILLNVRRIAAIGLHSRLWHASMCVGSSLSHNN